MTLHIYIYPKRALNADGQLGGPFNGQLGSSSRATLEGYAALPQVKAALDTIAWAEGGISYNTLFGGGTFSGSQHPNRAITAGGYTSTAAGRYQFLYSTWIGIANRLGLSDFSAHNQDIAAVALIEERGQLSKLISGDFEGVMKGLGCAWAALPYATCNQSMRPLSSTMSYFNAALAVYGGTAITPGESTIDDAGGYQISPTVAVVGLLAAYLLLS